ncbi:hypothetical protein GOP47_0010718 [Adiantum capillus-veneris]|uniref:Uncharacterized protein n=1 Tax=Adiantum capillus-veneris TaxID=13818 RepID=A0A9D4UWK4_ADICA|nr:hypothetical protein GOP47_0010718 [Adiantum capillus-veneris]
MHDNDDVAHNEGEDVADAQEGVGKDGSCPSGDRGSRYGRGERLEWADFKSSRLEVEWGSRDQEEWGWPRRGGPEAGGRRRQASCPCHNGRRGHM